TQSTSTIEKDYLKDISEIHSIMEKSPRFISLSALTGVLAGIYVLIGGCYQASWFGISSSLDLQSKTR
ncbi:MAG: hypothetical protein ACI83B_003519, partial [Sediminicola sp.]